MKLSLLSLLSVLFLWTGMAQAFETKATHAWVYDMTTNTVLLDKLGEDSVPPASMSKLMTIEMLFAALKEGRVQLDTTFAVSARAVSYTAMGGSTMYLQETDRPTVAELIKGMIVNSGNDACTVVAEGLEGSEEEFAKKMTERAKALGLTASRFANSSGWPDPGQRMSMRDLGMLAVHLITAYPDLYPAFSQTDYNYKNRAPANANNRNPILGVVAGADGLKTGHTEESGYGMVGSVKQGDRRIVFAFNGLTTDKERADEAERIANWAFRQFALKTVVTAGTEVAKADVFLGAAPTVGLAAEGDLRLLVPAGAGDGIAADVIYTGPLKAPIAKGAKVAQLVIRRPDMPDQTVDLVTTADVAPAGFLDRMKVAFTALRVKYGV